MKRIIAGLLVCSLVLGGCRTPNLNIDTSSSSNTENSQAEAVPSSDETVSTAEKPGVSDSDHQDKSLGAEVSFEDISDTELLRYLQDDIYLELVKTLDSDSYFVENVSSIYISNEYLKEVAYNSQANIYFGYTLAELEKQFSGTKYVFTLGNDGQTKVTEFNEYDDTYDQVFKNVAIGTGVILVCVTVSVVTGGTAPAVSMFFALSAKSGIIAALSGGALGGVAAGVVTGIQTNDFNEALKSAALVSSEDFKWGAISGALAGGAIETASLYGASRNGLTINEAAVIQRESAYPLDLIKSFNNMEQYEKCKEIGLTRKMIDGKSTLVQYIDLEYYDEASKMTNLERICTKHSPVDPKTGEVYELHHLGQNIDSTLVILTEEQHRIGESYRLWHSLSVEEGVHELLGGKWDGQRIEFWRSYAELWLNGGI